MLILFNPKLETGIQMEKFQFVSSSIIYHIKNIKYVRLRIRYEYTMQFKKNNVRPNIKKFNLFIELQICIM